jgi:hypothetical protein
VGEGRVATKGGIGLSWLVFYIVTVDLKGALNAIIAESRAGVYFLFRNYVSILGWHPLVDQRRSGTFTPVKAVQARIVGLDRSI